MRLPDWPERLQEQVEKHQATPFEWGKSDCFIFAIDCVQAMTGRDPREAYDINYASKLQAFRTLHRNGFDSYAAAIASEFREIHPAQAQRGDLVIISHDEGLTVGVMLGAQIIAKATNGHALLPRSRAIKAFRVE